jgi:predicted RNase H-like HicB family nuclease
VVANGSVRAERYLAARDRAKHPAAGTYREEAAVNGYVVVVERTEDGGYGAWSPDLPGCIATARSYDECVALMRDAVHGHLEVMRDHGDPVPEPRAVGALTVSAA